MSQVGINNFIDEVAEKQVLYNLQRFFEVVHSEFYKEVDISFMNYFLELVQKQDEFCVNHSKLYEYDVIEDKNENSKYIKKCLIEDNDFVEGEDYLVAQVSHQSDTSRGIKYKKVYMLKPKTFKLCLMRSKNCKQYSKYYLLLEEIYYYYTKYESAYNKIMLSGKNSEIKELIHKIDKQTTLIEKQSEENKKQSADIRTLMKYSEDANLMIEDANSKIDDLGIAINTIAPERNINPKNENKINYFCLLKISDSNEYQFIRGQKRHIDKVLKSMKIAKSKKFPEGKVFSEVVIPSTFVPNSIDIIVKVKERFIKEFIKKIYFPVISENDDLDNDEKKDLKYDERPFRLSGLVLTYKPNPYMPLDVFTKWLYRLLNENLQKDIPKIKK